MTLPLWGELQKSQDDARTIAQFVADEITAHNENSEAHLCECGSLSNHKKEGMIDHPAGSVASDKFAQARLLVTAFESIDGWADYKTGSGNIIQDFGSITLTSGVTSNSNAWLYAVPSGWIGFDTTKDFFWKATVRITSTTNQEIRFGTGAPGGGDGISGAGFEVSNGILYAYTDDYEDVDRTTISGITLNDWNVYEVRHDASANLFEFFVNGDLVHSETRIFTETQSDEIATFRIKNTASENKFMYVSDMVFQQER